MGSRGEVSIRKRANMMMRRRRIGSGGRGIRGGRMTSRRTPRLDGVPLGVQVASARLVHRSPPPIGTAPELHFFSWRAAYTSCATRSCI